MLNHTGDLPEERGIVRSWRETSSRENGDIRPVFFPAGSVDVRMPGVSKLRFVYVLAGSNPTTVEIKINTVDVAAQNPAKTVSIAAGAGQKFLLNAPTLNTGDRLQIVLSDAGATASAAFMAA